RRRPHPVHSDDFHSRTRPLRGYDPSRKQAGRKSTLPVVASPNCMRDTESRGMPDFCTCGAQLPPDALFCHKCGKPQRDIVEPEYIPPPPSIDVPPTAPVVDAPRPSFRNPVSVRIAIAVAAIGTLLSFMPLLNSVAAG